MGAITELCGAATPPDIQAPQPSISYSPGVPAPCGRASQRKGASCHCGSGDCQNLMGTALASGARWCKHREQACDRGKDRGMVRTHGRQNLAACFRRWLAYTSFL